MLRVLEEQLAVIGLLQGLGDVARNARAVEAGAGKEQILEAGDIGHGGLRMAGRGRAHIAPAGGQIQPSSRRTGALAAARPAPHKAAMPAPPAQTEASSAAAVPAPRPRRIGLVNGRGTWTLLLKEVRRFASVWQQTLAAPIVTTLLFLAIFSLALGGDARRIGTVPFDQFLAPGLVMMALAQNAFANTSSSLVISKVQGNIVDVLMAPLGPGELTVGYALAGAARGLAVGLVCVLAMSAFVPMRPADPALALYHALMGALMLSLLGLLAGIWSDKFDHIAAVTNFIVTPAAFLSGTFYSIERLPGFWNALAHANPLFYVIDGFRAGFIGQADGPLVAGMVVVAAVNAALWAACHRLFGLGYKLKA
jgi:ABC-2 type transport system permease protein